MAKRTFITLVLLTSILLAACGESEPEVDAQATEVAASVAATLTAQAPPPTMVVTPPPPPTDPPPTPDPTVEPTAGTDLMNLRLEADGSGDFATLEEALVESPVGATITLGPGVYRLDRAIAVGGSLHLIGAGMDETEIISAAPTYVLRFEGDGPFTAVGITFRHDGAEPADAVAVAGGEIRFESCRFTGGVYSDSTGDGSGLFLVGSTHGEIRDCDISENGFRGVFLWENSQPLLEGNMIRYNGSSGIAYYDQTGGTARNNDCSNNAVFGIYVDELAKPTLEENICNGNDSTGISYWGSSTGVARNNECSGNGKHGIGVEEEAHPSLEGNTLRDNGDSGIAYFDYSGGTAQANICAGNAKQGIYVGGNAAPTLVGNQCPLGGTAAETPSEPVAGRGKIGFVSTLDGVPGIYVMPAPGAQAQVNDDGSGMTLLTTSSGKDQHPAGSPDGSRIAFESDRDGNSEIYVINADGSGLTNLTNHPDRDGSPAWSPDGSRIAFSSRRDGNSEIYVMNADGSELVNLTNHPADDTSPAWSPDGSLILFDTRRDGNFEVYAMNVDGSGQTNLTNNPASDFYAAWSPDGSRIAFSTDRDRSGQIYVMNADGSGATALTNHPAGNGAPVWSPDGERILFTSYRDGEGELYTIKPNGTELTNLTNSPYVNDGWPDWWTGGRLPNPPVSPPAASGPRFNPEGDPWCFNIPDEAFAGDWQITAPRDFVVIYDSAEITLRNTQGSGSFPIVARVITPDETEATATATLVDDEWVTLVYRDDFGGGDIDQRGAYTIIWESQGVFIACDGFIVAGGASAP